ncbi:MAG: UDP-4-amino-4,6-dideoxy-N-acetyl-beta-L-altrosamine transaminase [Planctomycetes bacterium]|nr:UDP-4-amino-4,6-dideoxy-N-acetyl-beta-L-altrosamine transaminase [Planctomycetota bacterium]
MGEPNDISYGRQWIDEDDIAAVCRTLRGAWLTQGPAVEEFEKALCGVAGARYAVAVANGTAALHLAAIALGVGPGDTGIAPAITFTASANCLAYCGAKMRFADVDESSALIDVAKLAKQVKSLAAAGKTPKVIVPVDMCGQPADLPEIRKIADSVGARVLCDSAHSLGASYEADGAKHPAGCCLHSDAAILSFHPVKHITTGEGGAVLTNAPAIYARLRELRTHGIHKDAARFERTGEGPWYYEQAELGYNYRITDIQCALGISQLKKLGAFVARRRQIAARYDQTLSVKLLAEKLTPLRQLPGRESSYHLYVVRVRAGKGEGLDKVAELRKGLYEFLRQRKIFTQVHYIPVNWQPYYRKNHGSNFDECPSANAYYASCLSLPMYPAMTDDDQQRVIDSLTEWSRSR